MIYCDNCEASLTETDDEAGFCTQCRKEIPMWEWANDSPVWLKPRRTVYFLVKRAGNTTIYRKDKRGRVITYSTREQAIRIQNRLNVEQSHT